jgi:hypothetical protein
VGAILGAVARSFTGTKRFEIRRRIGEGAVGVVYEAFDRDHGRTIALKTLHTLGAEALLSLKNEFRAVQHVRHPNLVGSSELLEADGVWFVTMDLVHGMPFNAYVCQGSSTFDEDRLRRVLPQVVDGLRALHAAGILHRDLKPSNVLVTDEGRAAILDFGVASDARAPNLDDGMVGTPAYMAPEQVLGEPTGPSADWYALGVVLYEVLTGRLPFLGTFEHIVEAKLSQVPAAPRRLRPEVPEDLAALCMDLLRIAPALRPTGEECAARLGHGLHAAPIMMPQHTSLVGRRDELESLHEGIREARSGRGVAVLVSGESGVGKSFLVKTFLDRVRAEEPDVLVLRGRCYERESVPYKAFDEVIDRLSQHLAGLRDEAVAELMPPNAHLLRRAFPVLEGARSSAELDPQAADVLNPQELRARVFQGVRELFRRVARTRPVVIAIDDLQWADADSLSLLREVLRAPDEPQLLFIGTVRHGTVGHARSGDYTLELPGIVRHVRLTTLPAADAEELAAQLLREAGELSPTADQVRNIVEDAKGHPLFIDEIVRQRAGGHAHVEVRLDEALWERIQRLDPAARRVLELLAVAGTPLDQDTAARTAALEFAQLFEVASVLRAGALVRMSGAQRTDDIEPYHDRVRESVLAHLAPEVRASWHAQLAATLERESSSDPETVAGHWQGAGNGDRAVSYYVRAAEQAAHALAFERAARLFRTALDTTQHTPARVRELKRSVAEALTNAGQLAAAAEVRVDLSADAEPVEQLELRRIAAEQFMSSGHYERGFELLRTTLRTLGVYYPVSRFALLFSLLFARLVLALRGLGLVVKRPGSIEVRKRMVIDALWSAGMCFGMSDNVRGAYFYARSLLEALRAGDLERVVRALSIHICSTSAGGFSVREQTEKMLARERVLAAQLGTPDALAFASGAASFALFNNAQWRAAKTEIGIAEALFRDRCVGHAVHLNGLRSILFRTLFSLGDLHELRERSAPIIREAEQQNDRSLIIIYQSAAGSVLEMAADRPDEAQQAVQTATDLLARGVFHLQHYWTYTAACQVSLYRGDAAAAYERAAWLWPQLEKSLLRRVEACRIVVLALRARAAVALALTNEQRREELLLRAEADAQALENERAGWAAPLAHAIRGTVAAARGDGASAASLFVEAARGYDQQDMRLYAAAALRSHGQQLGESGIDSVRAADERFAKEGVLNPARMSVMLVGECR